MNITQVDGQIITEQLPPPTEADLQREYNYILAESLTGKLLEAGLINADEYEKIMDKNRRSFSPFLARIMP